jgi:hypothetical protein
LADIFKSSPLKQLGKMNRNLVDSIYGMSSINMATNLKQELPMAAIFANRWGGN